MSIGIRYLKRLLTGKTMEKRGRLRNTDLESFLLLRLSIFFFPECILISQDPESQSQDEWEKL